MQHSQDVALTWRHGYREGYGMPPSTRMIDPLV